jgi:8-oxo-dGTP pyrophosphatase MutT (NUDIX family)
MAERVLTQGFVVVGAIIEQDGKVLLVQENSGMDKGHWNQPAGWLDVGEDPIKAVAREVMEETGLMFEPTALIGIYSLVRKDRELLGHGIPHGTKLIFKGHHSGQIKIDPEEVADIRWFTKDEIEAMDLDTLRDLDIKKEVADYFAGRAFPLDIIRHTISE